MGLKITGIRIENFRKFREPFELDLVGPSGAPLDYVVLAGPNGCGKTTILEAFLLAFCRDDLIHEDMGSSADDATVPAKVPEGASIIVHLADGSTAPPTLWQAVRKHDSIEWRRRHPDDHKLWDSFVEAERLIHEAMDVEYISSRRLLSLVGPIEEVAKGRPPSNVERNRIWLLKNRILQQQGRRSKKRYRGPEPMDEAWLTKLNGFWRAFRDDGTTFDLDVVDPANTETTAWDLYLFRGDTRICAVDALSAGEQEVIAMAAPFITREFEGILLFDEPELHMHPEWQGRVVPALRTLIPHSQTIIATHADEPWDRAYSFQRFLLVPDNDPRSAVWRKAHPGAAE